jgi:hypothetical protein
MLRECSLPRLPRSRSPDDVDEPVRKRVNENGLGRRVDDGAIGHRARVPGCHGTTRKDRGRDACVTRASSCGKSRARGCEKGCGAVLEGGTTQGCCCVTSPRAAIKLRDDQLCRDGHRLGDARSVAPVAPILPVVRRVVEVTRPHRSAKE